MSIIIHPIVLMLILSIGCPLKAYGELYKWRDVNGVWHFSDSMPSDSQESEKNVETIATSDSVGLGDGYIENRLGMRFEFIQPGEFILGKLYTICDNDYVKKKPRKISLTSGFYIQATEVTQRQWASIMDINPSHFKSCGGNCPVEMVSWNQVQKFIEKLNEMETEFQYRLPTEVEWEYAARSGSDTKFCFGDDMEQLNNYGWFEKNSDMHTHPVASKKANSWGLYDMHGNVWEFCQDGFYHYKKEDPISNPKAVNPRSSKHVIRGGSYNNFDKYCWSASRCHDFSPIHGSQVIGFRLVLIKKRN